MHGLSIILFSDRAVPFNDADESAQIYYAMSPAAFRIIHRRIANDAQPVRSRL